MSEGVSLKAAEKDKTTLFEMQIHALNQKISRLEEAEVPLKNSQVLGHLVGGYAAAMTLGWWTGFHGAGTWFFFSSVGAISGLATVAVRDKTAQWVWRKISILRSASRLMKNKAIHPEGQSALLKLNQKLNQVYWNLLKSGRLATSFERWCYLKYLNSYFEWVENIEYQHEPVCLNSLNTALFIVSKIRQEAIEQFDQPIAAKAKVAKDHLIGRLGLYYMNHHWNDFQEWLKLHQLNEESVVEEALKLRSSYYPDRKDLKIELFRSESLVGNFLIRLTYDGDGSPSLQIGEAGLRYFQDRELATKVSLFWEDLVNQLPDGLWLRFSGVGQKTWEFYESSASLPFSSQIELGEVIVTRDPLRSWVPQVSTQIKKEMSVGTLSRELAGALGKPSKDSWARSRLRHFKQKCTRSLSFLRVSLRPF